MGTAFRIYHDTYMMTPVEREYWRSEYRWARRRTSPASAKALVAEKIDRIFSNLNRH